MGLLLFLVIFSATFLLFSEEVLGLLKKCSAVYWMRVTVPLVVISWIWIWYDELIPLGLLWLQDHIKMGVAEFSPIFPHSIQWLADALALFTLASLPVLGVYLTLRCRGIMMQSHTEMMMCVYAFSWVFFTALLLT